MSNEHEATIRELQTSLMRLHEDKQKLEAENRRLKYDVDAWVKAAEKFSIMSFKSKEERDSILLQISNAVRNEGPYPKHHRRIMNKHRREWPTLWNAIDKILEKSEK